MKRRVAIVRAVCAEGDLLLLDEPFTISSTSVLISYGRVLAMIGLSKILHKSRSTSSAAGAVGAALVHRFCIF